MDTSTILSLLSVLVVIFIIGIVVFFVTKSLLLFALPETPSFPDKFRPAEPTIPYEEPDIHYMERTLYDSDEMVIVDLPKKTSQQEDNAPRVWGFSFQREYIAPDAKCLITGKLIAECIRDCGRSGCEELRQKLHWRTK
jgi:hypothetical protein